MGKVTKDYLLISQNRSPKRVNLSPQKNYLKQSHGKIYPEYVESIDFSELETENCTWVNVHVNINFDEIVAVTNILTGEVQRLNITCKADEIIPCILKCMRIIDDRKYWESYESLYV